MRIGVPVKDVLVIDIGSLEESPVKDVLVIDFGSLEESSGECSTPKRLLELLS